jgi:hypothetical protein
MRPKLEQFIDSPLLSRTTIHSHLQWLAGRIAQGIIDSI